jgi:hypothetical protein
LVEWISAFETRRIVGRRKIDNIVDDIVKMLEYATGFRKTLDVSGSTVAKSRLHSKSPIEHQSLSDT